MPITNYYKHDPCTLIKRDTNISNTHCQILDNSYRITKPTIICLGGNCTLTPKDANAICKIAERLIGLKPPTAQNEFATSQDVDIIGIVYGLSYNKYNKKQNTSNLSLKDTENLTNNLLLPLVFNGGNKLDLTTACKNVQNITFLSHSIGARETAKIIANFAKLILENGYNQEEASAIISNITSVSFAPETTISGYFKSLSTPNLPTPQQFYIKSVKDYPFDIDYEQETKKSVQDFTGLEFVTSSPNEVSLYSSYFGTPSSVTEHMIQHVIHRSENWESISWVKNLKDEHYYISESADATSQCAAYILASSVSYALQNNNQEIFTPKPNIEEFVPICKDISSQFDNLPVA